MVYLDNAATTEMSEEVIVAVVKAMTDMYGNPSSKYSLGKEAREAMDEARYNVASLIGADPSNIIFTSGGTEANNAAVHGWIRKSTQHVGRRYDKNILYSRGEHDSIIHAAEAAEKYDDWAMTIPISLMEDGTVDIGHLSLALQMSKNPFVACMYVNNETGAVNSVKRIAEICERHSAFYHMDSVQAAGFEPIDVNDIMCSSLSISSHKIHGPKGVGALYIRDTDKIMPLICGGSSQEYGMRGGTENVPGIIGFGVACKAAKMKIEENREQISKIKSWFYSSLKSGLYRYGLQDRLYIHGPSEDVPSRIANFRIDGIDGETMILVMGMEDEIYMSSGSACRSGESKPSAVLTAMGVSDDDAHDAIRVSFSEFNTEDEAVLAGMKIAEYAKNMTKVVV